MVQAYDGLLLAADVFVLFLKVFYYILESTYRLFFPVEEKSVAGEIALVKKIFNFKYRRMRKLLKTQ